VRFVAESGTRIYSSRRVLIRICNASLVGPGSCGRRRTSDKPEVIQDQLLLALVRSKNEAADDVLVEALRLGDDGERGRALDALVRRRTVRGLCGVIGLFDRLPEPLQGTVLRELKAFYPAIREAGRSDNPTLRVAALRLIALGRQGKLAYVLSENLHDANESTARAAADAMAALARWAAGETRALQRGIPDSPADADHPAGTQAAGIRAC
jgi:hypothetical protein